jgi:hypothetical protein
MCAAAHTIGRRVRFVLVRVDNVRTQAWAVVSVDCEQESNEKRRMESRPR